MILKLYVITVIARVLIAVISYFAFSSFLDKAFILYRIIFFFLHLLYH